MLADDPEAPTTIRKRFNYPPLTGGRVTGSVVVDAGSVEAFDPLAAQALLDEYDRRFPAGVLREEMQATRAIARCAATPGPVAQEAARQFLMQHPASPLAARVAGSCNLPSR